VERSLGLMAGAGTLPGRAAAEAKRRGWRVAAFAFEEAPGLAEAADDGPGLGEIDVGQPNDVPLQGQGSLRRAVLHPAALRWPASRQAAW